MAWPVWVDGRLVDAGDARVSAFDHGLTVGDGEFETMRVYRGTPFALRRHLDRLARSAAGLALPLPTRAALEEACAAVVAAAGLLLTLRIGPDAAYVTDVLPGVLVFGLGLAILVAPLTAAVLAAAPREHAGAASGVNNAVARTAGLLAVALLPPLAGLTGEVYRNPAAFADGYRTATLLAAGLLVLGGLLSAALVSNEVGRIDAGEGRPDVDHCYSCPVDGPRLETVRSAHGERP
jgi:hypothetical protein